MGAQNRFVSDPKAELIKLFGAKRALVKFAKRITLVVGEERKVLHIESGSAAINPEGALGACPIPKPT